MHSPSAGPSIPQADVNLVRVRFAADPQDVGIGLYNPSTGEIRLSTVDAAGGHAGLAHSLAIPHDRDWRGFSFDLVGQTLKTAGLVK